MRKSYITGAIAALALAASSVGYSNVAMAQDNGRNGTSALIIGGLVAAALIGAIVILADNNDKPASP